ncbi:MAG: hypothetical protein AB8G05_13775 [Oligoflexales bacterium]
MSIYKVCLVYGILSKLFITEIIANPLAPEVKYTSNLNEIKKLLPDYSMKVIADLKVERSGSSTGFMKSLGIHIVVKKGKSYQLSATGLHLTGDNIPLQLENLYSSFPAEVPPHVKVKGEWKDHYLDDGNAANILGKNVNLIVEGTILQVPLLEPKPNFLAYYGAVVLAWGDIVEFSNDTYPIWAMELGTDYLHDYIMNRNLGAGMYVEYHKDKPHFHMPLSKDAGGFYLLGKKISEKIYHFSAFRIPYGKAIYTKKGALHSDAGLTGHRWIVGYDISNDFSTALIYNSEGEMVSVISE